MYQVSTHPVDALGVLVAAGGGLTDAADAVITGHTQMETIAYNYIVVGIVIKHNGAFFFRT